MKNERLMEIKKALKDITARISEEKLIYIPRAGELSDLIARLESAESALSTVAANTLDTHEHLSVLATEHFAKYLDNEA